MTSRQSCAWGSCGFFGRMTSLQSCAWGSCGFFGRMTSLQSCTWAGCGAMATAFGDAAARLSPNPLRRASPRPARINSPALRSGSNRIREHETYARLDTHASRALVAALGRGLTRHRRLGFIRAAARPCAALQAPPWRSTGGGPPLHLQRRARPGRGANEAQAPAVDGLAAQRRLRAPTGAKRAVRTFHARKTCLSRNAVKASCFAQGRKTVQRGEFGGKPRSGATERRSHRAAARPCAALPPGSTSG